VGEYPRTYDSIVDTLRDAAPGTAVDAINSGLRDALSDRGNAGALLGVGLVISLTRAGRPAPPRWSPRLLAPSER
jgi:membrane protein